MDNAATRRYTNRLRHKTKIYNRTSQGKQHKDDDGATIINFEDILGSIYSEEDTLEQIMWFIMAKQYSLKSGLIRFGGKR